MARAYWLMKSEPEAYGWDDLVREGVGEWDGVRNAQAARNLRAMSEGDRALFYHSRTGLCVVGIMQVVSTAHPDKGDETGRWVSVGVAPVRPFARPVTLQAMKGEAALANMPILRQSRLSVAPLSQAEYRHICSIGQTEPD